MSPAAAGLPGRLTRTVGVVALVMRSVPDAPLSLPGTSALGRASTTVTALAGLLTQVPPSSILTWKAVVPDGGAPGTLVLSGAKTRPRRSACSAAPMPWVLA